MANEFDAETLELLRRNSVDVSKLRPTNVPAKTPTNLVGIPGLKTYVDPNLQGTGSAGYVTPTASPTDAMFVEPNAKPTTFAHEAEHLLARRQLGNGSEINAMFDQLAGNKEARAAFVNDAVSVYPYLQEKYGVNSGYFQPEMIKYQGRRAPNLAYEQLATLASIEATTGVDLTKDPYLRKNLFKDSATREVYNALTGLRQTRLDSKDLPPHTRQKETDVSILDKIKEAVLPKRFSRGGHFDKPLPGGKKTI